MTAYFVLTHTITDPQKYREQYIPAVMPFLAKYKAEVVAAELEAKPLEGSPAKGVVVLRFPSEQAIQDFFADPAYQPVKQIRMGITANGNAVMAPGIQDAWLNSFAWKGRTLSCLVRVCRPLARRGRPSPVAGLPATSCRNRSEREAAAPGAKAVSPPSGQRHPRTPHRKDHHERDQHPVEAAPIAVLAPRPRNALLHRPRSSCGTDRRILTTQRAREGCCSARR